MDVLNDMINDNDNFIIFIFFTNVQQFAIISF
jgi:hypothetical protein